MKTNKIYIYIIHNFCRKTKFNIFKKISQTVTLTAFKKVLENTLRVKEWQLYNCTPLQLLMFSNNKQK